jgi:hypothetical protein
LGVFLENYNKAVAQGADFDRLMRTYWDEDLLTPLQKEMIYEHKVLSQEDILWMGLGKARASTMVPKDQLVARSEFGEIGYYGAENQLKAYYKKTGEWIPVVDYDYTAPTGYKARMYEGKKIKVSLPEEVDYPSSFTESPLYQVISGGPMAGEYAQKFERATQLHGYEWKDRAKAPIGLGKAGLQISTLKAR